MVAEHASNCQKKTGIPASVTIAQCILESGWGQSGLSSTANNFFGIKAGRSWQGMVYSGSTWEEYGGKKVQYKGSGQVYASKAQALKVGCPAETLFRYYDSFTECLVDKSKVFYNGLYEGALSYRGNSAEFLTRMAGTYATDSQYASKLQDFMTRYQLTQYDVHPSSWALDASIVKGHWYDAWARAYLKDEPASKPARALPLPGANITVFDAALGKPVFYTGSAWVDANGNPV